MIVEFNYVKTNVLIMEPAIKENVNVQRDGKEMTAR